MAAFDAAAQVNASAKVTHNLCYALMMSGQLARGLSLMDRVAPQLREMSVELAAISDQDRGEALLLAGMHEVARRNLQGAADLFGRRRWPRAQAEAELVLARTWVVDAPRIAITMARPAGRRFAKTGASARVLQCEAVEVACRMEMGRESPQSASRIAAGLARQGLRRDATWMRVYAAKAALGTRRSTAVVRLPASTDLSTRLLAYEVRAQAKERPRDALRVLRAGLDELHQWQATLGGENQLMVGRVQRAFHAITRSFISTKYSRSFGNAWTGMPVVRSMA